jgi:hypothetical protein
MSLVLVIAAAAGCAAVTGQSQIDPKGSYPVLGEGTANYAPFGQLSVTQVPTPVPVGQWQLYWIPPGYNVYGQDGSLLMRGLQDPVILPEGQYLVQLERPTSEPSTFWVPVTGGLVTQVDLNRSPQLWILPENPEVPGAR